MKSILEYAVSASKIVAVFVALISGVYCLLIPSAFPDYKSYLPLIAGAGMAALISGYVVYRARIESEILNRIMLSLGSASVVAGVVFFLSLLVVVNVRGS